MLSPVWQGPGLTAGNLVHGWPVCAPTEEPEERKTPGSLSEAHQALRPCWPRWLGVLSPRTQGPL